MDFLNYFPEEIKKQLQKYIEPHNYKTLEEIRIRLNRQIFLKWNDGFQNVEYIIKTEDILNIMEKITENSLYSYQRQICEGYITLKGGHRVGISR